jgi:hypothetical protein
MSAVVMAASPLSLAAGDFNHDGYPDMAVGYATP